MVVYRVRFEDELRREGMYGCCIGGGVDNGGGGGETSRSCSISLDVPRRSSNSPHPPPARHTTHPYRWNGRHLEHNSEPASPARHGEKECDEKAPETKGKRDFATKPCVEGCHHDGRVRGEWRKRAVTHGRDGWRRVQPIPVDVGDENAGTHRNVHEMQNGVQHGRHGGTSKARRVLEDREDRGHGRKSDPKHQQCPVKPARE